MKKLLLADVSDSPPTPSGCWSLAGLTRKTPLGAVPVGYGTDLLGALQVEESREFLIRGEVLSPIEIIRSATTIGAQIIRQEGKLGTLKAGAFADLLLIDGDPLKNLGVFQEQGKYLAAIMKGGKFHKSLPH